MAPGSCREGLGNFAGWQTAALNVHKKTLPGPQGLVGAAGKVCRGLSGAWELQGRVWRVFAGWQTAALNVLKRTAGKVCRGLSGAWELAAGERLASFAGWQTAALNVLKRTLPGPAGKVCCGLSGAWGLQGRFGAALNVRP